MTEPLTVVGLGSMTGGDDAVGLHVVAVAALPDGAARALWADDDALTLCARLLEVPGPVLVVDCAELGSAPGTALTVDPDEHTLRPAAGSVSTHAFGFSEALTLARALGFSAPIRVLGVQPFDVSPRTDLSDGMARLLPALVAQAEAAARELCPEAPP